MHQTVQDIGQAFGVRTFHQDIVYIFQDRHLLILLRMFRVSQGFIFVGDPLPCIGFDQGLVKKLFFLMVHVRDQEGEKDMQLLDLGGKGGGIHRGAV